MKKIYLFLAGLIFCFNSQSQINQFVDSSMYGGKIQAFAKNASCVLVATEGGIFKTTNLGQSWTNASQNFDPNSVRCNEIVSIGNDFYAMANGDNGSTIYKSTDNGTNWSSISLTNWWPQSVGKISNTLYAIGGNNFGGSLYSSTDGNSWSQKALIWDNMWPGGNCKLLSFNQNKLYIVFNNLLLYTLDGNTIDTVTTSGLMSSGFNNDNNFAGDGSGNIYYNENSVLYKYNFTSKIWIDISTGKIATGFDIIDFSVTDNAIFIIAMNSSAGMRFYKSSNQGSTFTELTTTGLSIPMIGQIIEVSPNNFIGNWLDDRIMISSNGGSTWSWTANQFIATYAGNLTLSGNSLLFSREIKGFISSSNQGLNWSSTNNGIPGFGGIAWFVDEILQVKDTLFSFCRPDPTNDQVVLYKSSNNGVLWISSPIPVPYNSGEEYSFAGKCDSALFVNYFDINTFDYALIVSFNNGNTWTKPNIQNTSAPVYLKGPQNCLFAFYAQNNTWEDFTNVSKANNFAANFTDLNTGGLFNSNFLIKRLQNDNGDKGGAMMDFDAANNKAVFVVRDRMFGNGIERLYVYNILSHNWSEIITSGLPLNYIANSIKYVGNNVWLLATSTGLYKSTNAGIDWVITHNTNNWQNGIIINSIQIIGNKVFLGSVANGVWKVDLTVGILEHVIANDLQIFPNPANDIVNVFIPDFNGKTAAISLYSFDGKKIINKEFTVNQFQLDLHHLSSGSYFLVINSNNTIYSKTIIVK